MDEFFSRVKRSGREHARTPMQWSSDENSGFTSGTPWIKVNPNYRTINVEADSASPGSISKFYKRMIKIRKSRPCLIYGDFEQTCPDDQTVFGYRRHECEEEYLIVLNFSDQVVETTQVSFGPEGPYSWFLV